MKIVASLSMLHAAVASSGTVRGNGKSITDDGEMLSPIQNFYPSLMTSSIQGTTIVVPYIPQKSSLPFIRSSDNDPGPPMSSTIPNGADDDLLNHESQDCYHQNAVVLFQRNSISSQLQRKLNENVLSYQINDYTGGTNRKRRWKSIDQLSLIYDSLYDEDIVADANPWHEEEFDSYFTADSVGRLDQSSSVRWTILGLPSEGRDRNNFCLLAMTGLFVDVDYLTRQVQSMVHQYRVIFEESDNNASVDQTLASSHFYARRSITPVNRVLLKLAYFLRESTMNTNSRPYGVQALLIGVNGGTVENVVNKNQHEQIPYGFSTSSDATSSSQRVTSLLHIYTMDPSGSYRHCCGATAIGRNASIVRQRLRLLLSSTLSNCQPETGYDALRTALYASMLKVPIQGNWKNNDQVDSRYGTQQSDIYDAYLIWHDFSHNNVVKCTAIDPDQVHSIIANILAPYENTKEIFNR